MAMHKTRACATLAHRQKRASRSAVGLWRSRTQITRFGVASGAHLSKQAAGQISGYARHRRHGSHAAASGDDGVAACSCAERRPRTPGYAALRARKLRVSGPCEVLADFGYAVAGTLLRDATPLLALTPHVAASAGLPAQGRRVGSRTDARPLSVPNGPTARVPPPCQAAAGRRCQHSGRMPRRSRCAARWASAC